MSHPELPPFVTLLHDLGEDMLLCEAELSALKEQDVNARILPPAEHNQLVNNIRQRGKLESVPYCSLNRSAVEIVSGHHRVKAAVEAGVMTAPILLDVSGMSRSELVAKQIAHNRLSGFDDQDTLMELFGMLESPDDILQSGMANDVIEIPEADFKPFRTPALNIDWQTVTFTFLPHQVEDYQALVATIPASAEIGVLPMDRYQAFMDAVLRYGQATNVRNISTLVALMIERMNEESARTEREREKTDDEDGAAP